MLSGDDDRRTWRGAALGRFELLDAEDVSLLDTVLFPSGADDGVHGGCLG